MRTRTRLIAATAVGAISITGIAGLAGAKGGVNAATGGIRSALTLVSGEDPSIPGGATAAAADARFTGKVSKVTISGVDARSYPITVRNNLNQNVNPCSITMTLGSNSGTALFAADPKVAGANTASVSWNAVTSTGDASTIDIVCDWTDKKGVHNHHETHWAGTL